jgi:hypothetical protein
MIGQNVDCQIECSRKRGPDDAAIDSEGSQEEKMTKLAMVNFEQETFRDLGETDCWGRRVVLDKVVGCGHRWVRGLCEGIAWCPGVWGWVRQVHAKGVAGRGNMASRRQMVISWVSREISL